jgi:hypothetical protein
VESLRCVYILMSFRAPRSHERLRRIEAGNSRVAKASLLATCAAALALAGCGDFWQNPYATDSTGGTTSSSTTLTASPTTATVGSDVTLTATVSPSAATGTVTFYSNSTSIGSADLDSGSATTTYSPTSAGTDSLAASYSGDDTYESSTSNSVSLTVSAAASSSRTGAGSRAVASADSSSEPNPAATPASVATTAYEAAPIHATSAFSAKGGVFTAKNAEAVVAEGKGTITLTGAKLTAAAGNGRGVLLYQSGKNTGKPGFSMTGGSLAYDCSADANPGCAQSSNAPGRSRPATLFAVANADATVSLTDATVTNNTATDTNSNGTLLTVAARPAGGADGASGGNAVFLSRGTELTGDVIVDQASTADLSILEDASGRGSMLNGAVNTAQTGKTVSLKLDSQSQWTVTANSYVTDLDGLDLEGKTVGNINGGGHCVFYSGKINSQRDTTVYTLGGGGYLAPAGTQGLACE